MSVHCPYCDQRVTQRRNEEGPNYCAQCNKLFSLPPDRPVPPWILGILVILTANWQIIMNTNMLA